MRPQNVGIHAIETYFPKTYISQEELEQFDGVSKGKYTLGLGQKNMSFVEPYEDVNSLALTVVQNTLDKYKIDPRMIGRLEVGTETLLDKSKSTKTVLMQLFSKYGNHDIEGITTINACYGGTAALFNTLAWVESSAYDGKRLGCVVTVDVAVYKKGPARPTGGAGAICMIIGPNAPIIVEPIRSTFIDHAYDFYKPDPRSEFPTVDGHLSINTYLGAIDNNFKTINQKYAVANLRQLTLQDVDYGCFHAPFAKMVQKAFTRLFYNDVLSGNNKEIQVSEQNYTLLKNGDYNSKEVQEVLAKLAAKEWNNKVKPSLYMGENLGNIYTGSLYAGLCSLICNDTIDMRNKRVIMFSYGSGLASSMFFLRFGEDYSFIKSVLNLKERMSSRVKVSIPEYDQIMADREKAFGFIPTTPSVNSERLSEGVFYLSSVDKMWRRQYERFQEQSTFVKSSQISKNNCSSSSTDFDSNKVLIIDDATFNEQKARLNERLVTIKNQIITQAEGQQTIDLKGKKRSHSSDKNQNSKIWSGFYKKTLRERLDQIQKGCAQYNNNQLIDIQNQIGQPML